MSKEESAEYYNQVYTTGGAGGQYHLPPEQTQYLPMWEDVLRRISPTSSGVLDVGCGPGQTAQLCIAKGLPYASGIDFSQVAIDHAKKRNPENAHRFAVADILSPAAYARHPFDTIMCLEVLEHLEKDREVVSLWPARTHCIISVPNYNSIGHVRVFETERQVLKRYAEFFVEPSITRIPMSKYRCIWVLEGKRNLKKI